jgi:hypothetical protein
VKEQEIEKIKKTKQTLIGQGTTNKGKWRKTTRTNIQIYTLHLNNLIDRKAEQIDLTWWSTMAKSSE